jgi:large subunit ribosomal protein L4
MNLSLYNIKGEKTGNVKVSDDIFKIKASDKLIVQAIRVYLSNQRQSPAKTKSRSEVKASGRKIYRQKGTGRARHGDIKAPIFVKGGIAHGPTGKQNFKLKMSKPMKKKAFLLALTKKASDNKVIAVSGLNKLEPKTKKMADFLKTVNLGVLKEKEVKKLTLVLTDMKQENILRAGRNLDYLVIRSASMLNTYNVLNSRLLIFEKDALKKLEERYKKG